MITITPPSRESFTLILEHGVAGPQRLIAHVLEWRGPFFARVRVEYPPENDGTAVVLGEFVLPRAWLLAT